MTTDEKLNTPDPIMTPFSTDHQAIQNHNARMETVLMCTQYDVIILRGVSGSGKSTIVRKLQKNGFEVISVKDALTSEDIDDWQVNTKSRLKKARFFCLRHFHARLEEGDCAVVIDDNNLSMAEIAPYYVTAEAFGHSVCILEINMDPKTAAKMTSKSVSTIRRQAKIIEENTKLLPSKWNRIVVMGG